MWLMTDQFSRLRMREASQDFGRGRAAVLVTFGCSRDSRGPLALWTAIPHM
jgi:hypothetical protein